MGEAGFDVCKRNMGRNLFIEKSGKIVGKYTSTRDHHGGLYLFEDYKKDSDRKPRFVWDRVEKVLLADKAHQKSCKPGTASFKPHILCTNECKEGVNWGMEQCFIANSFNTGVNRILVRTRTGLGPH